MREYENDDDANELRGFADKKMLNGLHIELEQFK